MEQAQHLLFGPFRLDPMTERLWRGTQEVPLRAKPWAVLRYLVEHPGRVVTKEELLKTVWAGTYVTKTVLKVCIREIRAALGEEVGAPRYLATVGRLGYQLLREGEAEESDPEGQAARPAARRIVGRSPELAQLQHWLTQAERGDRRLVFVTGEPGIGKTALVDLFVEHLRARNQVRIGRGQCIEQYGAGEAYLPVLEAFGQVCRAPGGQQMRDVLSRSAPTWLAQMPGVVNEADVEALQRTVQGATRERMLREITEAIEALTTERPLVLVFEDLHWSDVSTLEFLAYLARRRERARLLVLGTYRPTEVIVSDHPLKGVVQELHAHQQCAELPLDLLTARDVTDYVTGQFAVETSDQGDSQSAATHFHQLAHVIHRRSEGNPLFMVDLVDHLVRQGLVAETTGRWQVQGEVEELARGIPESLRQLIERQLARLSREEQRVLEVASVAGAAFTVAAVAAGSKEEAEAIEETCEGLAWQRLFLQEESVEEWPDGTVSGCYRFRHVLYHSVLYERVAAARRVRLHRQIAEREEAAYGVRVGEIATALAVHFEQGRDYRKAVHYLQQAGQSALRRAAYVEAIAHLTRGLELLKTLPDTPDRIAPELALQTALGATLMITKGYGAPEVETAYARAYELWQQVGETPQLFPILLGLTLFSLVRGRVQSAYERAGQCLGMAERAQDPILLTVVHQLLGSILFHQGEFPQARSYLERALASYEPGQHHTYMLLHGHDPGVFGSSYLAWCLWCLGYPEQALSKTADALALARRLGSPYMLSAALGMAFIACEWFHETATLPAMLEENQHLCRKHEFGSLAIIVTLHQALLHTYEGRIEEGIQLLRQFLATWQTTGNTLSDPYYLDRLAEGYRKAGQAEEGLTLVAEALAMEHSRYREADLYRLKGELLLVQENKKQKAQGKRQKAKRETSPQPLTPSTQEAEACFLKAVDTARQQQAKSLELRATMSLARLWQQQGKKQQAHKMLSKVYHWFTEGFDTKDLQEAKALLDSLT